jgi:hypothetical protein
MHLRESSRRTEGCGGGGQATCCDGDEGTVEGKLSSSSRGGAILLAFLLLFFFQEALNSVKKGHGDGNGDTALSLCLYKGRLRASGRPGRPLNYSGRQKRLFFVSFSYSV